MEKLSLFEYFEELEIEQAYDGYFYSVAQGITIVILGSLSGLKNVRQIWLWATNAKVREFLKEKFQIERIPCYYWLLCLLKMIGPASLNKCFAAWVSSMLPLARQVTLAIDEKTIRSTGKMQSYDTALHIISAQTGELGMSHAQKSAEGKSNEIPAVRELLAELDIKEFETKQGRSSEWQYYISSRVLTAEGLLYHARQEWSVECMHWLLDVHFGEDYCRVANRTIQQNLNMARKFLLNIIRRYKPQSTSNQAFSNIMLQCLLDNSYISEVLGKN